MQKVSYKKGILNLTLLLFLFLSLFMSRLVCSPLLSTIQKELNLSYTMTGNIFLFIALGASLGLLLNALIANTITHKKIVFLSSFFSGIICISIYFIESYTLFLLFVFLMGIVNGGYFPSGFSVITSFIKKKDLGKAFAYHDIAPVMACISVPIFAEVILHFSSWRSCFVFLGLMQVFMSFLFLLFGKGGDYNSKTMNFATIKEIANQKVFQKMLITTCIAVSAAIGVYAVLPLFLIKNHHYTREVANQLIAASKFLAPFSTLFFGFITDKFGQNITLKIYCIFTGILTCAIGFFSGKLLVVVIFLQAIAITSFFPTFFTCIHQIYKKEERGIILSFMNIFANIIGVGMFPFVSGILAEYNRFNLSFIILGVLVFLTIFLQPFSEETN